MKNKRKLYLGIFLLIFLCFSCSSPKPRVNDSSCDDNCLDDAKMMRDECLNDVEDYYATCLERDPDESIFGSCKRPYNSKRTMCYKRFCYNKKKCGCPLSMLEKGRCAGLF